MELIDKTVLEAEIFAKIKKYATFDAGGDEKLEAMYGAASKALMDILRFMNTLDVISPDGEKIERSNFKVGIEKDIKSDLFNQLTKMKSYTDIEQSKKLAF